MYLNLRTSIKLRNVSRKKDFINIFFFHSFKRHIYMKSRDFSKYICLKLKKALNCHMIGFFIDINILNVVEICVRASELHWMCLSANE